VSLTNVDSARSVRKLPRATQLLLRVVATGWFDLDTIAHALVVPRLILEKYLNGSEPIPLDRQLCLALFLIERVPPLARQGRHLRCQVQAVIAFQSGETQIHNFPPPTVKFP
jgi:hypothetical protein